MRVIASATVVLVLCVACVPLEPTSHTFVEGRATFTAHPSDQTVLEGQSATFAVTASGSGTISYQWERSDDNGATWSTVLGATGPSYVAPVSILADNGTQFLCVVSNEAGSVESQPATLTVEPSYGGWWEVYLDGAPLEPLIALEFQHTGTTVRYLNIVMTLVDNVIYGVNDGGLGYDLTVVDHDKLQGAVLFGGNLTDVTLLRRAPNGTQSAQGAFDFASTTSYACAEVASSDVYFVSVDHMGCDRSVMVEIEAWSAPLLPGTYVVGDEVDIGIHIEDIVGGQYAYSSYIAVGGSITFTAIDTTRVAGTYEIATILGETITGSFDVPVFVIWS